jgi:hypothetical protein
MFLLLKYYEESVVSFATFLTMKGLSSIVNIPYLLEGISTISKYTLNMGGHHLEVGHEMEGSPAWRVKGQPPDVITAKC